MSMTVEQIEAEVLQLPQQAQEELLSRLMRSLTDSACIDSDVSDEWTKEAVRRDEEMESGMVTGIPADEMFEL